LQQLLEVEGPLRAVEKGGQQSVFAFGQRHLGPAGVGEPPAAPIELPATETVLTALRISWGRGASDLLPAQHGADPRQQLPKANATARCVRALRRICTVEGHLWLRPVSASGHCNINLLEIDERQRVAAMVSIPFGCI